MTALGTDPRGPVPGPAPRHAEVRAVVGDPDFRRLWTTRLLGQLADGAFTTSLAGAVFFNPEHATSAAQAAAGFSVLLLPYSLVGPFAGVFLDRWRRQRVLLTVNLVRALLVCVVASVVLLQGPDGLAFYGTALATVSLNRFVLAGLSASLPHVTTRPRLVLANSLSTTTGTAAATLGGGLALLVRPLVGSGDEGSATVALCAALVYALAGLAANRMPAGLLGPDGEHPHATITRALRAVVGDFVAGARHISSHRPAAHALAAIGAHRFFYGLSFIATLLLYRNYAPFQTDGLLRGGIVGLGQVIFASTLGVLAGAVLTPAVTRRITKQAWIVTVFATASVVEVAFGLPYTQASFLVAALFLGLAAQASKICVDTIIQESVEDEFRGRVFSVYDTLFNLTFVSAAVVAVGLLPADGKSRPTLALIAAGYAVTAAVYAAVSFSRAAPATD